MLHALRNALLPVVILGVASALSGCKSDCETKDGVTTCEGETTVQYIGSLSQGIEVPWVAGQALRVGVAGGNVRVGDATLSIQIDRPGTALPAGCTDATKVCVAFRPINNDTRENEAKAKAQMTTADQGGSLSLSATNNNSDVIVEVKGDATNGAFNSSLSAQVFVVLPTGFDGDIITNSASGDQIIDGIRSGLKVTAHGDVSALVVAPITPIANGAKERSITTSLGDITFQVPLGANISIQGQTTGVDSDEVLLQGQPAGWAQVEGSSQQSATFCGNTACNGGVSDGNFSLKTELGDILIATY